MKTLYEITARAISILDLFYLSSNRELAKEIADDCRHLPTRGVSNFESIITRAKDGAPLPGGVMQQCQRCGMTYYREYIQKEWDIIREIKIKRSKRIRGANNYRY